MPAGLNMAILNAIQKANSITMNLGYSTPALVVNIVENAAIPFLPVQKNLLLLPQFRGQLELRLT